MGAFPRLTDNLLDTTRQQFDFTQSLSDTLGDLGTSSDGFDSAVSDTIILLSSGVGLAGSLDDDLNLAGVLAGSIDPNSLLSDLQSLPDSLAEGNAVLADVTSLAGEATGTPPPPTGGSGGSGGSSGTLPVSNRTARLDGTNCAGALPWPVDGTRALPFTQAVPLVNNSTKAVTIAKATLVQPNAGVFTATTDCTGTLAPGARCTFFVTQQQHASNGIIVGIELQLSSPTLTETICIQVGLTVGQPGGHPGPIFGGG